MARARGQKDRALARKKPDKALGHVHWIFCEGATEARCLHDLRARWRLSSVQVQIVEQVGTPWTIVERARQKRDELKNVQNVTIYVVFDRDEHPRFQESIQRAQALGFVLGVSVPCIELWGLLLHADQRAHIERHAAQRRLRELHTNYHHERNPYLDLELVLAGLGDALRRADELQRLAIERGEPFCNPSTGFGEVIRRIRPSGGA
jgi:hypothetical protein